MLPIVDPEGDLRMEDQMMIDLSAVRGGLEGCIQEILEDGPADDTYGFRVEASHLGNFRFTPGDVFYFSTIREAKPGDDVAVALYRGAGDHGSSEPIPDLIVRKLIKASKKEVVLGPSPGAGTKIERIPRDRIKGVFPWVGTGFQ